MTGFEISPVTLNRSNDIGHFFPTPILEFLSATPYTGDFILYGCQHSALSSATADILVCAPLPKMSSIITAQQ